MKSILNYINESKNSKDIKTDSDINGFCILKPGFLDKEEDWYKLLSNNGWSIINKVKKTLDINTAKKLYIDKKDEKYYNDLCKYMSSGPCISCVCHKDDIKNPINDMKKLKHQVRDAWGKNEMENGMHSSDSLDNINREQQLVFAPNGMDND